MIRSLNLEIDRILTYNRGINYRLLLQYDGTDYQGWQVQPSRPTIQGTLTSAIEKIAGECISLVGSGRTDTGVHARGQVANFHTDRQLAPEVWWRALNSILPPSIRVLRIARAASGFHARYDATSKTYAYYILNRPIVPPWESRYCLQITRPLDVAAMQRAAAYFPGEKDLQSFSAAGGDLRSYIRRIDVSCVHARGSRIIYTVEASGFLPHMVRNILGTLLEIGMGRRSADDIPSILAARDRQSAGPAALPQGLFLEKVHYSRKLKGVAAIGSSATEETVIESDPTTSQ